MRCLDGGSSFVPCFCEFKTERSTSGRVRQNRIILLFLLNFFQLFHPLLNNSTLSPSPQTGSGKKKNEKTAATSTEERETYAPYIIDTMSGHPKQRMLFEGFEIRTATGEMAGMYGLTGTVLSHT